MYFDIHKTTTGYPQKYWWVARSSGNHEALCSSEMLSSKQTCKNAIALIKREAADAAVYDETGEVSGTTSERRIAV